VYVIQIACYSYYLYSMFIYVIIERKTDKYRNWCFINELDVHNDLPSYIIKILKNVTNIINRKLPVCYPW